MAEQNNQNLQYAEQLLREGRKQEARTVLAEYVRGHPSSTRGWWMLSFALTDPKQQIECVERVLRLDSNYTPAHARLEKLKGNVFVQPSVSPFVDSTPSQPAIVSDQPAKQNPLPSASQNPALRKKTNNLVLQYAALAVMACVAMGALGFAAVMIVQGNSSVPMQSAPAVQPTAITPLSLPPTWTPTTTATLIATQTLSPKNTPLVMTTLATPTLYVLPTIPIPKSQIAPVKGSYAPDFSLTNVNGNQKVKLSNYGGKAVIIFFWATWCQYCKAEMSSMKLIYQAYESQGLVVLAVDVGESAGLARKYSEGNSLTFPVLNDAGSDVSSKYRVTAFPTHFFINPSGIVTSVNVGAMDYLGLNTKVRAMLNLAP
ncbi:MAG: redoxin domain-containing protein [Anaerolineales bacterium]|nr:redoxin domain-containing protein [Anaerolineales bacterium]